MGEPDQPDRIAGLIRLKCLPDGSANASAVIDPQLRSIGIMTLLVERVGLDTERPGGWLDTGAHTVTAWAQGNHPGGRPAVQPVFDPAHPAGLETHPAPPMPSRTPPLHRFSNLSMMRLWLTWAGCRRPPGATTPARCVRPGALSGWRPWIYAPCHPRSSAAAPPSCWPSPRRPPTRRSAAGYSTVRRPSPTRPG